MKPVLIDAANDLAAFASKDETQDAKSGIHFGSNGTEATDGRQLIRVPYVDLKIEDFPSVAGVTDKMSEIVVSPETVTVAIKSAPKHNRLVRVSTKIDGGKTKGQFAIADLTNVHVMESGTIELNYPNIDIVIPTATPTLTIKVSAGLLKVIVDYAIKHEQKDAPARIDFAFLGSVDPVRWSTRLKDGRIATGVFMPCRGENQC